jgi:hypothetical protein
MKVGTLIQRNEAEVFGMAGDWLKLENKEGAAQAICRMGEEDLHYLNHLIVDRLKLMAQARSTILLAEFAVGDRVSFRTDEGDSHIGTIQRLNKKSATIRTDDGHRWTVYPSYLRQIK